ncbi:hypothetical protein QNH26_19985 [Peribacillus frigoritolerans]|uniref:hypothetical protein n=1 Tax=Peribacillus frigoritolerans TaxID=450367 RepID=UPI0024C1911C|nr:hypothetical protein [Peribacillus frigoritolerans]WHX65933.1 hypothetical protein QNH26_19985 [Peribacillus frigoritolerans]
MFPLITREFGHFTREFCCFTREFEHFTREFALFTREFAFIPELGHFTRKFALFTREFGQFLVNLHLLVSLSSLLVNMRYLLVSFENKKIFRLYIIGRLVSCHHHYTYKPST